MFDDVVTIELRAIAGATYPLGRETEISPAACGARARRTLSLVRDHRTGASPGYAAVYPGLAAGDYTVWQDSVTPVGTVTIHADPSSGHWGWRGHRGQRGCWGSGGVRFSRRLRAA